MRQVDKQPIYFKVHQLRVDASKHHQNDDNDKEDDKEDKYERGEEDKEEDNNNNDKNGARNASASRAPGMFFLFFSLVFSTYDYLF
jgi:hypothetical protein